MDYNVEDTQNSGPDSAVTLENSKLGIGATRTDNTQKVTKRCVFIFNGKSQKTFFLPISTRERWCVRVTAKQIIIAFCLLSLCLAFTRTAGNPYSSQGSHANTV